MPIRQKEVDPLSGIVTDVVDEINRPGHVVGDEPVVHLVDEGRIVSEPVTVAAGVDGPFRDDDRFVVRRAKAATSRDPRNRCAGVEHLFRLADRGGVVGIAGREDRVVVGLIVDIEGDVIHIAVPRIGVFDVP